MLHHCACAAHERVGNIWYLLPEYSQCRKAIWQAINPHTGKLRLDEAFPIEIRKSTNQQEMSITLLNGSMFPIDKARQPHSRKTTSDILEAIV